MLIKSNFKDYYDYALNDFVAEPDKSVTYVRELKIVPYKGITRLQDKKEINYAWINENTSGTLNPKFLVYFDGEFYGGTQKIHYQRTDYKKEILKEEFIYEKDILNYFSKDKDTIELIKELGKSSPIVTLKMFNQVLETCPDIPYKNVSSKEYEELRKKNTKVVLSDTINHKTNIVLNDSLKNVQFNKILNPYQVYQRIESFVIKQNSIEKNVNFTDKEKINQHGFDEFSFRN